MIHRRPLEGFYNETRPFPRSSETKNDQRKETVFFSACLSLCVCVCVCVLNEMRRNQWPQSSSIVRNPTDGEGPRRNGRDEATANQYGRRGSRSSFFFCFSLLFLEHDPRKSVENIKERKGSRTGQLESIDENRCSLSLSLSTVTMMTMMIALGPFQSSLSV